ncbi:MAG: hypothetical protein JW723_12245 [Bacteroidales bacterium]|nr:hypothetical protein [Bacteroidales bacterium]
MKGVIRISMLAVILIILPGSSLHRIDYRKGINNNVCKTLKDNVLVYYIFVDSQETTPWTEFDIKTTIDSLTVAVRWLESQARAFGISLNIIQDYYIGEDYTTIKKALPFGNVINSLNEPSLSKGIRALNNWADIIAKRAGYTFNISEKNGIPEIKNPRNKERLVAYLRDEKQVESVALLFMVNNYYKNDISVVLNTMGNEDVEFAIVSYKYPSVIAHNILNLFGAADLNKSEFRRNEKKIAMAGQFFPNDIMQDNNFMNIQNFEIGEYTRYLIGWSTELDSQYEPLLQDKIAFF